MLRIFGELMAEEKILNAKEKFIVMSFQQVHRPRNVYYIRTSNRFTNGVVDVCMGAEIRDWIVEIQKAIKLTHALAELGVKIDTGSAIY
jgi:hypothetical protein